MKKSTDVYWNLMFLFNLFYLNRVWCTWSTYTQQYSWRSKIGLSSKQL